jgi:hypothetical protein
MIKDITIGQYFAGSSPLHRMDARMKRAFAALLCALLLALCACGQAEQEPTEAPTTMTEASTLPRDKIESIYHTVTACIHPDMPEFTFGIIGAWTCVFHRKLNGEIEYDALNMRESINIREIQVCKADGQFVQWLAGFETNQNTKTENYGFELQDFNHDGYLDIVLYDRPGVVDPMHLFWLWDAKQKKFVQNQQLQEINGEWQFFQLDDDGRIKAFSRSGGGREWGLAWYQYRNGMFVLVESEDSEILFEEGEPVGKHTVVKKLIGGKMQIVSDTRERVEE